MDNDRLEALLHDLPGEQPPAGLAQRICKEIRERHTHRRQRAMQIRMAFSALLGLTGSWLALPLLAGAFQDMAFHASGVPVVVEWYEKARLDQVLWLGATLQSVVSFQEDLAADLGSTAWIGLIILTLGSLLVLDQFLPRASTE